MVQKIYLIVLVDRKQAILFTLQNGAILSKAIYKHGYVPQKVKHGDDTWDAQDKIFRHIEDHLHRHLQHVVEKLKEFSKDNRYSSIIIGGHKPMFTKIIKHIPYPYNKKVKGTFVTELKAPFNEILKRAKRTIEKIEDGDRHE